MSEFTPIRLPWLAGALKRSGMTARELAAKADCHPRTIASAIRREENPMVYRSQDFYGNEEMAHRAMSEPHMRRCELCNMMFVARHNSKRGPRPVSLWRWASCNADHAARLGHIHPERITPEERKRRQRAPLFEQAETLKSGSHPLTKG